MLSSNLIVVCVCVCVCVCMSDAWMCVFVNICNSAPKCTYNLKVSFIVAVSVLVSV